jgi:fibro-slime domain-containing protein
VHLSISRRDTKSTLCPSQQLRGQEGIYSSPATRYFPLDKLGVTPASEYAVATIPPSYFGLPEGADIDDPCELGTGCNPCWPIECIRGEDGRDPGGDCAPEGEDNDWYDCHDDSPRHNFHFTTQTGFWFTYDPGTDYTIGFAGDDDLWVFVGGQLIMDLGGIHAVQKAEVTLDGPLSLVAGKIYEVMVFHAERQTHVSTYKLALEGFNFLRSVCQPMCGDGIVSLGEECDDGINDGGYGECAPGCVLGEHCGDSIVQPEFESCDDGNFLNGDACPSSCRIITVV